MSKKSRYLLLLSGCIIFIVSAPLLIMYVGGWVYNSSTGSLVRTGLLAVRSEPKDANIYLDGKLTRKTSGDIKFLFPREYEVSLKKDGYLPWNKRLRISIGQVTWANPTFSKIFLFKKDAPTKTLNSGVSDFAIANDTLFYITGLNLAVGRLDNPDTYKTYPLPFAAKKIILSPNSRFAALRGESNFLLFDFNTKKYTDLSSLLDPSAQIKFSPQNELYALQRQTLFRFNFGKKQPMLKNILAFGFEGDDIYYVNSPTAAPPGGKQPLNFAPINTKSSGDFAALNPNILKGSNQLWVANGPANEGQMIISNLPDFQNGDLFITSNKQILLLADRTLYALNSGLEQVSNNLDSWDFNQSPHQFIFSRGGELASFNFTDNREEFITRSQESISLPKISTLTNYAFYVKNNTLYGIEIDARDHQNQYQFYTGSEIKKLFINNSASEAWVLDNGLLINLTLR